MVKKLLPPLLYYQNRPSDNYEWVRLILKRAEEPLSFHLLRYLTGLDHSHLWKILKTLEQFGEVEKVTKSEISLFYKYRGDRNEK